MSVSQLTPTIPVKALRWHHGHLMKFLVTTQQTNGAFSVIEMTLCRGWEPPKHIHEREDEFFYIQEGTMRFTIGDRVIEAKAGDTIFLPRMILHGFEVVTPSAKVLTYMTPGHFEGFFYELSEEATEAVLPTMPAGPPSAEVLSQIMETSVRYGLRYA